SRIRSVRLAPRRRVCSPTSTRPRSLLSPRKARPKLRRRGCAGAHVYHVGASTPRRRPRESSKAFARAGCWAAMNEACLGRPTQPWSLAPRDENLEVRLGVYGPHRELGSDVPVAVRIVTSELCDSGVLVADGIPIHELEPGDVIRADLDIVGRKVRSAERSV